MRTSIIRIGNSKGIRIPKVLLRESRLGNEVELKVEGDAIVIRPVSSPREGWEEKFRAMAEKGDDRLLDEGAGERTEWEKDEWEW